MRGTAGDTRFKCGVEECGYRMTPEVPVCENKSQWSKADKCRSTPV